MRYTIEGREPDGVGDKYGSDGFQITVLVEAVAKRPTSGQNWTVVRLVSPGLFEALYESMEPARAATSRRNFSGYLVDRSVRWRRHPSHR